MEIIKIIGIIALVVFIVAYVCRKAWDWIHIPIDPHLKVEEIIGYVCVGSLTLGISCGIIHLFF